ncbi:MAG: hypothetical protein FIB02_06170 [Desulfuromonas sp.]|nr:hypothetical protein [Desulfuromonas sp.]
MILLLILGLPGMAAAAEFQLKSDTLFRFFERHTNREKEFSIAPAYEYLQVDVGSSSEPGLSFHGYGWGRADLANDGYFEDDTAGEILYGYLEYRGKEANFNARLGRQYIFEGVANEAVDGLRLSTDLGRYFSASVYGGQSVALDSENGRDGDSIYGGRLAHHLKGWYDVGVSYKEIENENDLAEKMLGVDLGVYLPYGVGLYGFSSRNLDTDGWGEHSYELRFKLAGIDIRPYYQQFRYEDQFDTGANGAYPFRFLAETDEEIKVVGADATMKVGESWDFGVKAKNYDYDRRDDNTQYYSVLATWYADGRSSLGGEAGVMNGDAAEDDYVLLRAYAYWDRLPKLLPLSFLTGEVVWVDYREAIYDEDTSLFVSLGAGKRFLEDALEIKLSGDYSRDPYFDDEVKGMLTISYLLGRPN